MSTSASYALPVYALRLVRERPVRYAAPRASTPSDAARILQSAIGDSDREVLAVLLLDGDLAPRGLHRVAIGSLNATRATAREIFKAAIVANASAMVLGHNHPSARLVPSPEDVAFTAKVADLGEMLGISLVDHVIVGPEPGPYYSFAETGGIRRA